MGIVPGPVIVSTLFNVEQITFDYQFIAYLCDLRHGNMKGLDSLNPNETRVGQEYGGMHAFGAKLG